MSQKINADARLIEMLQEIWSAYSDEVFDWDCVLDSFAESFQNE